MPATLLAAGVLAAALLAGGYHESTYSLLAAAAWLGLALAYALRPPPGPPAAALALRPRGRRRRATPALSRRLIGVFPIPAVTRLLPWDARPWVARGELERACDVDRAEPALLRAYHPLGGCAIGSPGSGCPHA